VNELYVMCPGGCGCRLGTEDADAQECGCDEGCCDDDGSGPTGQLTAVELTKAQARYLSVLAARGIAMDEFRRLEEVVRRHREAWATLQPACAWDEDWDEDEGRPFA
jgi:hypothetical protein